MFVVGGRRVCRCEMGDATHADNVFLLVYLDIPVSAHATVGGTRSGGGEEEKESGGE